ncbi:MAG: sulfatase-like hydrolase/transferase [Gemmatimonadaceae bacterium]
MRWSALRVAVLTPLVAALNTRTAPAQRPSSTAERPNVVLVITDDVGYGDIGSYGARDIRTPNIDRLARQGVRLTDFYAAPQCTPTRAALITGRYQQRVRLERALGSLGASLEQGLAPTGRSLPQLLKNNGYATALIGKWHLGYKPELGPNAHGFDYFYGFLSGYIDFYTHTRGGDGLPDLYENTVPVADSGYMTDLITARAVRFIERSRARPFFLEVAYNAAHWPFQPPDRPSRAANNGAFQGPGDSLPATRKDYVAMLERADTGVGQILATLDRLGLARNTLVIFTNDNGGEWLSSNAPLFHRKDTLWEGGIRVPMIARWPARLPTGKTSAQPGITMDLTATILAATKTPVPTDAALEGMDLLPILEGRSPARERTLFWRIATTTRQQRAVRKGSWKLLLDGDDLLLFDLRADIGERRDLASRYPDVVRALGRSLAEWEKNVDAEAAARGTGR